MLAPLVVIDQRLAELREVLSRVRANLADLDADVTLRMLVASTTLRGRSAELRDATVAKYNHLWEGQLALDSAFEELLALRGSRSYLPKAKVDQLSALLDSAPVALSPFDGDAVTPQLTGAAHAGSTIPLSEVLERMSADYQAVLAVLAEVNEAWSVTGPKAAALAESAAQLRRAIDESGRRRPNELTPLCQRLEGLERDTRDDPVSVDASSLSDAEEVLARLQISMRTAAEEERQVGERVEELSSAIDSCRSVLSALRAERQRRLDRIAHAADEPDELAAADAELEGHEQRLEALRLRVTAAPGEALRVAGQMLEQVNKLSARVAALASIESRGVATRDELRGRLDALWAKAQATGRIEDPEVREIHAAALDALFSAPCDLAASEELVEGLQLALRPVSAARPERGDAR